MVVDPPNGGEILLENADETRVNSGAARVPLSFGPLLNRLGPLRPVPSLKSPLPRWIRLSMAWLGLAMAMANAHAAEPNPAQALIDRAWAAARTDPDASSRDANAALEILSRKPDVDL